MPEINSLPRSTPEAQGISSTAIIHFISTAEKLLQYLHSFILLRHNQVIAEGWWHPWRAETPHMLFSLTKSFTSTAVGMAIAEGLLSVDDPVLSFFPALAPRKVSSNLAEMKVQHLLTMTTGHDLDTTERMIKNPNPIKKFLSLPVEHAPGTHFVYNSGASFILSSIVQKLTGQTLLGYLTPRLFTPLGIQGATWESHPNGVNFGGWGLSIKTEDIARFGLLYLQRGQWKGQRILHSSWVEAATSKQVPNGDDPNSDWTQGYGYQFWRCRHNMYRGDGAFGQYCIVMPDQDVVLAITAGVTDMQEVLNLVWDSLLPALGKNGLPESESEYRSLLSVQKNLKIAPPHGAICLPRSDTYSGRSYFFTPNSGTLRKINFNFGKDKCDITYQLLGGGKRRGIHHLSVGYETWIDGVSYLVSVTPQPVATSGVWTDKDTFTITMCQYETLFIQTIVCQFSDDKLLYNCKVNVSFGPVEPIQLVGVAG
jgi:Beta-lactamase